MSDYLFDGGGPPDPRVRELEDRLAPLRDEPRGLPLLPPRKASEPRGRLRRLARPAVLLPVLLAASLVLAAGALFVLRPAGWEVAFEGNGRVSSLRPGEQLSTGSRQARLSVGAIGFLRLEPATRVRLLSASAADHRIALESGTLHARIWAPPRRFFVETATATAVDLGCAYTLSADEAGNGHLSVTSGWVSFERKAPAGLDEVAVPAGASCRLRAGRGPGAPAWDDASPAFRAALERLEAEGEDAASAPALLGQLLGAARSSDALTLLALSPRLGTSGRERVWERLAALSTPPAELRERFVSGDPLALPALREALGLPVP